MAQEKCRSANPLTCTDPRCPERSGFFNSVQKHLSQTQVLPGSKTSKFLQGKVLELMGTENFIQLLSGKEIGHRIADKVDDYLADLIGQNFGGVFQNTDGSFSFPSEDRKIVKRSAGDIWVPNGDKMVPINIKTGVNAAGSPNMVAMKKLISLVEEGTIDEYNILHVKFNIADNQQDNFKFTLLQHS